jgi:hypothetical protein
MKYIRGDQDYALEDKPLLKVNLLDRNGDPEGIWVRQADDHVVLQNFALAFYPFPSWGVVLPSDNPPGDRRETIDATVLMQGPMELPLHPEAWDSLRADGLIDEDGTLDVEALKAAQ